MKKFSSTLFLLLSIFSLAQCGKKENKQISNVAIFEIPSKQIDKSIQFYENIFGIKLLNVEFEGMKMAIFPTEDQQVTGVIIEAEGYEPSANGVTIYLNAGKNLERTLDLIPKNGGKILIPKTPHADQNGFFAIFLDIDGNKLGLHSSD
ncbi:glyoxalase-like domain protein [Leptospira ryugenii]|uniref:Glyoxalase-like domain protein n=1 Tax=Leptospira ryugenii TaxID=1917863 RepID=A0A2P2DXF7_9LEPT|nr:VOC family protein [Leptospira ryugenii]GBF49309.1 glyoxalase-like domain protein [Leptospira ryugenii]